MRELMEARIKGEEWAFQVKLTANEQETYQKIVDEQDFAAELGLTVNTTEVVDLSRENGQASTSLVRENGQASTSTTNGAAQVTSQTDWIEEWVKGHAEEAAEMVSVMSSEMRDRAADCDDEILGTLYKYRDWNAKDWAKKYFVDFGYELDHEPKEVFDAVFDEYHGEAKQQPLKWDQYPKKKLSDMKEKLTYYATIYLSSVGVSEVSKSVAMVCAKLSPEELVDYIVMSGVSSDEDILPADAVRRMISAARKELIYVRVPWRDMDIDDVIQEMRTRKATGRLDGSYDFNLGDVEVDEDIKEMVSIDKELEAKDHLPPIVEPSSLVTGDKWAQQWVKLNPERILVIVNTMKKFANQQYSDANNGLISLSSHVQDMYFQLDMWNKEDFISTLYLRNGRSLESDPINVLKYYASTVTIYLRNLLEKVPKWNFKSERIGNYKTRLPGYCAQYLKSDACNEVMKPIALLCSKMDWIDLAAYIRQAGRPLWVKESPGKAVVLILSKVRNDLIESRIPWRDLEIDELVAIMMERKRSDIRLGEGRRALLANKDYVQDLNDNRPSLLSRDVEQLAEEVTIQDAETVGREYRVHAENCMDKNCFCLSY